MILIGLKIFSTHITMHYNLHFHLPTGFLWLSIRRENDWRQCIVIFLETFVQWKVGITEHLQKKHHYFMIFCQRYKFRHSLQNSKLWLTTVFVQYSKYYLEILRLSALTAGGNFIFYLKKWTGGSLLGWGWRKIGWRSTLFCNWFFFYITCLSSIVITQFYTLLGDS